MDDREENTVLRADLDDKDGAIDDLRAWVDQLTKEREVYKRVLVDLGRRVNGWESGEVSPQLLSSIPVNLDVLLNTKQREVEQKEEKIEELRQTIDRMIQRRMQYKKMRAKAKKRGQRARLQLRKP